MKGNPKTSSRKPTAVGGREPTAVGGPSLSITLGCSPQMTGMGNKNWPIPTHVELFQQALFAEDSPWPGWVSQVCVEVEALATLTPFSPR
jgi:hypothetical protein